MPPVSTILALDMSGAYVLEDNGNPTDGISQLRGPDGSIVTVEHPLSLLEIVATAPGVSLQINLAESLGSAQLIVGDIGDPTKSPESIIVDNLQSDDTVTLAARGRITESTLDESPQDIIAPRLIMSAGTGVGLNGNPIEIQTGVLEAETGTGGIWLENYADVVIGGLTDQIAGLDVGTSGDLFFFNAGSIRLSDTTSGQVVHGGASSGNVKILAFGFGSNISSDVDQVAVTAMGGNVELLAGGDIILGGGPSGTANNDVFAAGSVVFRGDRIHLGGDSDVVSDAYGRGGATSVEITGRSGIELDANASVTAAGFDFGNVRLVTDPGGSVALYSDGSDAVHSASGVVTVIADAIAIAATSGITSPNAVSLMPASLGRAIALGSAAEPLDKLALGGVELNRIFSPSLIVGNDGSGPLGIDGVVDLAYVGNLLLRSRGDIRIDDTITVSGSVTLETAGTVVQALGANVGTGFYAVYVDVDRFAEDQDEVGAAPQFLGPRSLLSPFALYGGDDGDTLVGNGAIDHLFGGGGNDTLRGLAANDELSGADGSDVIDGGTGVDVLRGGTGNDAYNVDDALDVIVELAGDGSDTVSSSVSYTLGAGVQVETLNTNNAAGIGAINLAGNELAQSLYGNAGNNILNGDGGSDSLNGLGGNDTLIGGTGADVMRGGIGNDSYSVDTAADTVFEAVGEGNDSLLVSTSYTLAATQSIETMATTNAASTTALDLTGNELNNSIFGNNGVNVLAGGFGNDSLRGEGGNDTLRGGAGNDVLRGGTGLDNFLFNTALNAATNVDQVIDFVVADDTIQLDDAVFTGLATGTLSANAFVIGSAAADADDRIIYNSATGALFFDADGNGAGAQVQFATLATGLALTNADFAVI